MNTEEIKKDIVARIENIDYQLDNNRKILSRLCVDSEVYEVIYRLHLEGKQDKKDLQALLESL